MFFFFISNDKIFSTHSFIFRKKNKRKNILTVWKIRNIMHCSLDKQTQKNVSKKCWMSFMDQPKFYWPPNSFPVQLIFPMSKSSWILTYRSVLMGSRHSKNYSHRVGRTGRFGQNGIVINLIDTVEVFRSYKTLSEKFGFRIRRANF